MIQRLPIIAVAAVCLLACGCKPKAKEITSLQRKEAAALVSEAEFAVQLRDYARAEGLYAKAAELCPDTSDFWIATGQMRMRLGQREPARAAYKSALAACEAAVVDAKDPGPMLQHVYVLALLGRADEARAAIAKAQKKFPDDRNVRGFVEDKQLDRMLTDPRFKELSL